MALWDHATSRLLAVSPPIARPARGVCLGLPGPWLAVIAKILPTTLGANATRQILFSHQTLGGAWGDHSLQWAGLHAAIMLALGVVGFQAAIRRGLREGRLGP